MVTVLQNGLVMCQFKEIEIKLEHLRIIWNMLLV